MPATRLRQLDHISRSPGVYLFFDKSGSPIYVGKAKNLRRRLSQYRKTKRLRKHERMRRIVRDLHRYEVRLCETELDALLLENQLIQKLKPKWNLSGAFYFMYPCLAFRHSGSDLFFVYSTDPQAFLDSKSETYRIFGSYRSRSVTKKAYYAMSRLLNYVGHREKKGARTMTLPPIKRFRERQFRQITEDWKRLIEQFLDGKSRLFLEKLVATLVERSKARRRASEIQGYIDDLARFYAIEAQRLQFIRDRLNLGSAFVSQADRDRYYMLAKFGTLAQRTDFHAHQATQSLP